MDEKILVVDDEREIADLIELYLRNEGFTVRTFYAAREAFDCVLRETPDLAILDIMLPDTDGFALCRKIRETQNFPIIMLTARDGELDKITGLTLGADDYVTKPFCPPELVARVKAQLRRSKRYNNAIAAGPPPAALTCGVLALDADAHECTLNGAPLALTPTEFTILRVLLERRGTAVRSEQLFHAVWGEEYYDKNNNTITVHIRHLREKLGASAGLVKTVWGLGYKIECAARFDFGENTN
ncbi:MAG: response regulator transcription factor [Clostridiales Family XIII bacterium]|jgi:two-component system response regulator VanR|nr:response regulator transcription factor [Clostridiales Family XIII bacterium]